jgi:hypothetical protein
MNTPETPIVASVDLDTTRKPKINITDENKENFFKCVLSDTPYEETFELFDGQFKVKFRALTVEQNSDVVAQIMADRRNKVATDTDDYSIAVASYRLGLSLVSINDKEYSMITKDKYIDIDETGNTYVKVRSNPLRQYATYKLSLLLDAFQNFESKLIKLTTEVQTPNFWKASV